MVNNRWLSGRTESECEWLVNQRQRLIEASCSSACKSSYFLRRDLRWLFPAARKHFRIDRHITLKVELWQLHLSRLGPMATSTTPQPYTADRPENSTTSVDASVGLPLYRSLARWMFSRSALISSRRRRVYVLLLGSQNKAVCGKQLVRFLFERSQDDRRQSATIRAFVVAQSAQDFLEVSLRSLEEGGQVLAFGGLKSLQSQALESILFIAILPTTRVSDEAANSYSTTNG